MNSASRKTQVLFVVIFLVITVAMMIGKNYIETINVFVLENLIAEENNDDFNFSLTFSTFGKCKIDTFKSTFTKDLVMDGTKTIRFVIPKEVKDEIFKAMMDIDIMSFPDELKNGEMSTTPYCDYKLVIHAFGRNKTIIWNEGLHPDIRPEDQEYVPENNKKFLNIVDKIENYIYSTEEYKKMPEVNGGYD